MSEQRAAAHISGFYVVLAAVLSALLSVPVGWWLKSLQETKKVNDDIGPQSAAVSSPQSTKSFTNDKGPAQQDTGALLRRNEPKQKDAQPTSITMDAYFRMLADEGVPALDVAKQYIGRKVNWTGYFYSLDTDLDSVAQRYRVLLTHVPEGFSDYLYFYMPANAEAELARLRKKAKVTVSGVLTGRTTLSDAKIESVEN